MRLTLEQAEHYIAELEEELRCCRKVSEMKSKLISYMDKKGGGKGNG